MTTVEISEFPYVGTIYRIVQGKGREKDTKAIIYEGEMDLYLATDEVGRTLQTANYIISMPLTADEYGNWIFPRKDDEISLTRYGETILFTVDNAEPSQLGGVSIHVARKSWKPTESES